MLPAIRQRIVSAARRPWLRNTVLTVVALAALYGLLGTFALPPVLKSQIETVAAAKLHRRITVDRVEVRPFALAVSLHGVQVMEPDGRTVFASLQQATVRISTASLFYLAPVVKELRVTGPFVHWVRAAPNRYSTDDIVAALAAASAAQPSTEPTPARPARFSVYNIRIEGGRFEFDDEPEHAHHTVADVRLDIPFLSSLPSKEEVFVEPLLSATVNGAPLLVKGKARPFAEPKEAVVDLDLDRVDLPRYLEYLPFPPRFRMPGGQLDVHLQASFQQPAEKPPTVTLAGTVALRSLEITGLEQQPMIKLSELAVAVARADPLGGRIELSRVSFDAPDLNLERSADGKFNLLLLLPPQAKPAEPPPPAASAAPSEPATAGLALSIGEIALRDGSVRYTERDPAHPLSVELKNFELSIGDTVLDSTGRSLAIGRIESKGAQFRVRQGRAETDREAAPTPAAPAAPAATAARPTAPAAAAAPPLTVSVEHVQIGDWTARIESLGLPQMAVTTLSAVTLAADGMSTAAGKAGKVALSASVNRKGSLSISGDVGIEPLHMDVALNLKGVDLLAAQPYVTERINLLVTQADLSARGRLRLDQARAGDLKGGFRGDASLGNLTTIDKISANDFVSWKSLGFTGVDVRLQPLALDIDRIALDDFFARVIVDPSGRINLQDIIRAEPAERRSLTEAAERKAEAAPAGAAPAAPAEAAPPAQAAPPAAEAAPQAMPPIKIREVGLQGGRVRFTDNFIKPNYTANLVDLGGTVSGLSSDASTTAAVDLRGQVNSAPLTIAGRINPIKGDLFLDLKASVHGMELAPLSPYSDKYVGYGIERGKLSFDVAYKLENRQLAAENRLILDQLTFGEKVDSPTATSLPVQLAIALLKDRNGVIDINLPIGGSLDDPQFSVGGLLVRVIVNLVTKAVTAPFALLGKLFGGGEELSFIEFDPGRGAIPPAAESKLTSLAKALNDRPGLKLEITAMVDRDSDAEALRREKLDRRIRAQKLKDLVAKGQSATIDSVEVSAQEYPDLLGRIFAADNPGKPPAKPLDAAGKPLELTPQDKERLLLEATPVGDDELTNLGNQRSQAVKDWLLKSGQVPEERMFLVATRINAPAADAQTAAPKGNASRVQFSLK
jgi:uncharacterized protein involved in outer membrane biogenesis